MASSSKISLIEFYLNEYFIFFSSKVEITTHVGPHRRLWMGPQFHFKHYSEATVSVCHPNSNVFTADSPQTSISVIDADLKSLPYVCYSSSYHYLFIFDFRIHYPKSTPVRVPSTYKDIAPAYIEVGSGSFQDAPSLSIYGTSLDSLKSDFETELMEKLADAANDTPTKHSLLKIF